MQSQTDLCAPAARQEPIAIIGVAGIFPGARDVKQYWSNLRRGVDSISEIPPTHWNPADYFDADPKRPDHTYCRRGGFLSPLEFDPTAYGIAPNSLEATDTSQVLGLLAAHEALIDAGYGGGREFDRSRVSVILGVTGTLELAISLGGRLGHPIWRKALAKAGIREDVAEKIVRDIGDSYVAWQENSFPGLLGNVVAGRIANRLDLGGTNCVVDAACASSISAAHLAVMELASGRADMAITGGVDTFNDIFMYMCFSKTPALSPTGDSRPFDQKADGTILGEGVGMAVLKRLSDAERDGDRILAVVKGIGTSSDGRGKAIYAPSASGQVRALKEAYARADVSPATVELVEAHGTGTKVGDAAEVAALKEVYSAAGKSGAWCALGSVKSQIGHTKSAAGAAGMIKAALALANKVLPPTIKVEKPAAEASDPKGPFYLNLKKRPWLPRRDHPRRAAVSSFGFGGSNFHMVLEEHGREKHEIDWDGQVEILALSAESLAEIRERVRGWAGGLKWSELKRAAAQSRRDFRSSHPFRLLLVLEEGKSDLRAIFSEALARLESESGERSWSLPQGVYFGSKSLAGKLAFLFPGQGSQYAGMCLDLACLFPQMQRALSQADVAYGDIKDIARQLSDFIYPIPIIAPDADRMNELALRATDIAQPAIGAISMGLICVLALFGVHPALAAGHSFGELVALFAGGRITPTQLYHLSKLRGELMAAEAQGDSGTMTAVEAPAEEIERALREEGIEATLANMNAPRQTVISGATREIERAEAALAARRIRAVRLPVSAAFHSPLVAGAAAPFARALAGEAVERGTIPVYANATAAPYPEDAEAARELLGRQIAAPVRFAEEIEAMYAAGARIFLEVGPGAKLTGLVRATLGDRPHLALSADATSGKAGGTRDLARALAELAAAGVPLDLKPWEDGEALLAREASKSAPKMTVMISGANFQPQKNSGGAETAPAPSVAPAPSAARAPEPAAPENEFASERPAAEPALRPPAQPPRHAGSATASGGGFDSADSFGASSLPPASLPSYAPSHSQMIPASSQAAPPPGEMDGLAALQLLQRQMTELQRLQQQTAMIHRQFLEGQEAAQGAYLELMERQQRVYERGGTQAWIEPAAPAARIEARAWPEPPREVAASAAAYAASEDFESPRRADIPREPNIERPAAPAPAAETARASAPATAPSGGGGRLAALLLETVSEKTGYPAEMLKLDMDLESDLGIDSIKRVEILSAMQERAPEAKVVEPERLGALRTLRQIVEELGSLPGAEAAPQRVPAIAPASPNAQAASDAPKRPPAPNGADAEMEKLLVAIVSEKTGYPAEMLKLDMDLESDLGIDSIKRVEILSSFQERAPEAPVVQPEDLGKFRTLAQILEFLAGAGEQTGAAPEAKPAAPSPAPRAEPRPAPIAAAALEPAKIAVNGAAGPAAPANGKHYAAPAAHMPLPVTAPAKPRTDLRIARRALATAPLDRGERAALQLPPGSLVWITEDGSGLDLALCRRFEERGIRARPIAASRIPDLERAGDLAGLVILAPNTVLQVGELWSEQAEVFLKQAFRLSRALAPKLRAAAERGGALFAAVSRLDGAFGLSRCELGADPAQGALAGLVKTAAREWPGVACKMLDAARDWDEPEELADALADELLLAGPVEVGLSPGGAVELQLAEEAPPAGGAPAGAAFEPGEVVIVSGGARGVTAECAVELARRARPVLVLLGRTPTPEAEPAWLRGISGEAEMKRAILENANGAAPTPRALEEKYRRWAANREIIGTLERLRAAGSRALYAQIDLRDEDALAETLERVRRDIGPIAGVIHGAGVLADRKIEEKTDEQFDAVFDTKVRGLRALLRATEKDRLRVVALFSSVSARAGRAGQADYAMANEALNKAAQALALRRPESRVVALNWGPWEGGMATPALIKIFEAEGIHAIPARLGAEAFAREIFEPASASVEVVLMAEPAGGGAEKNGARGAASAAGEPAPASPPPAGELAFERELDVERYPFLGSHVIKGQAVLPMAVAAEWLAHGALHLNPGFYVHGLNDLRIYKGLAIPAGEKRLVRVYSTRARPRDAYPVVKVELRGGEDGRVLHAGAEVALASSLPSAGHGRLAPNYAQPFPHSVDAVYDRLLFHGPALHAIRSIEGWSETGLAAELASAPAPAEWMKEPPRSAWLLEPLALDGAFQLMVLWCLERFGDPALPSCFARYRQYRAEFPKGGVRAIVRASAKGRTATGDVEFVDRAGSLVARIDGCECVMDPALRDAFGRRTLEPALGA